MKPTPLGPYRLQWLAAFSIAHRDPWPEVDAWLAENIDNQQTLIIDHADAAEIGATAAGLLLTRNGGSPAAFGLQATADAAAYRTETARFSLHRRGRRPARPPVVETASGGSQEPGEKIDAQRGLKP